MYLQLAKYLANSFVTVQEGFIFVRGCNAVYFPAVAVQHDRGPAAMRRMHFSLRSCVNFYTKEGVAVSLSLITRDLP
jgi:hypothetical protein